MDIENRHELIAYLQETNHIAADESPTLTVLAGGVSNRTVYVQRGNGEEWVIKQALEKLRVPVDWFSSPERIQQEALGLRWLAELTPPGSLPDFVFEDRAQNLLAMTAVPQPHENWKTMLLAGQLIDDHIRQFAEVLGAIHRRAALRHDELARIFADRRFFESLRLEPYYNFTAAQVPESRSFLRALVEETRGARLSLVHGDYSPKNILVYDARLILLDHEVIHFGDPAFDLGFAMTHLLSKAHHLPAYRGRFLDAVDLFWQRYFEHLGALPWRADLEPRAARHTLGCLLARVDGRSQLEYLSDAEKRRQRDVVLTLIAHPPTTIKALIDAFGSAL